MERYQTVSDETSLVIAWFFIQISHIFIINFDQSEKVSYKFQAIKTRYILILSDEIKTRLSHRAGCWKRGVRQKKSNFKQYLKYKHYQIYFQMSEFEDTDSILRNIDIDENWQEKDICLDCNITESLELPTLVFVVENNIQNVVEWKGTETTGKQKGSWRRYIEERY